MIALFVAFDTRSVKNVVEYVVIGKPTGSESAMRIVICLPCDSAGAAHASATAAPSAAATRMHPY